jgi:hypothetical protein
MSIFDLKTELKDLSSSNEGVSDYSYHEYTSSRDITGTNFPNGRFVIPWELSSESWWIPSRSYMRMRCSLTKGAATGTDGAQLTLSDKVAPNMNLAANLFQSMELQLNGKTLSRCSDNVAQVDTLENRLHQSKSWMDSIGASINWLQESVDKRINAVSSNGTVDTTDMKFICDMRDPGFGVTLGATTLATNVITAATAGVSIADTMITITNTTTALIAGNLNAFNNKILPGDYIVFSNGDERQVAARCYADYTTGECCRLQAATIQILCTFGAKRDQTGDLTALSQFAVYRPRPSRRITGFELIWQPKCLSVFKYSGALPCGKYELICTPHNASGDNYKIRAIEVPQRVLTPNLPTFGTLATNIKFEVKDVRFYAAQVVGERVENLEYFLDLEQTRLQTALLTNTTSMSKEYFNVSPLTHAITVAYQDVNAGIDPRKSASRFKVADVVDEKTAVVGLEDPELKLTRLFCQYAGKSFPSPDADPEYKLTTSDDYTTQRYTETMINNGSFFSEGGGETIEEWQSRGSYHYFNTNKDGQDRSTRLTVNQTFAGDFNNKARILVFDHSKQTAKIVIQNGQVVSVDVLDA